MVNIYNCCYKTIKKQYNALLKHEEGVLVDRDIEEIHQMRVAVRRIRAALIAFEPCLNQSYVSLFIDDLKQLASNLGAVRDLDVSIVSFNAYMEQFPEDDGIKYLINHYQAKRKSNLKKLFKFLKSKKYIKLKKKLLIFIDHLKDESNKPDTERQYNAFYKSFEELIDEVFSFKKIDNIKDSEKDLHNLRIAIKHLRYNLEFISLQEKEAKKILRKLKYYQEKLGVINDCNIMNKRINKLLKKQTLDSNILNLISNFIVFNKELKANEKSKIDLPWNTLSDKEIKKLYIPET